MPLLDRIGVDVIEMMMPIPLVSNHMLPIPSLPDASFPLAHPADGNAFAMREHSKETGLDVCRFAYGNDSWDCIPAYRASRVTPGSRPATAL